MRFTSNEPFTINPVNISLMRNERLTKKRLYNAALDTLGQIWRGEIKNNGSISYNPVNPDKKGNYINYYSPVYAGRDSIIAIRTSLSDPPCFVLINPSAGSEKKLHVPGHMYPWVITYGNRKLVWVENQPDPRWDNRNYSVIKILDLRSMTTTRLTGRTRYMAAAVSPEGNMIAAVENTTEDMNELVFIDPDRGRITGTSIVPENVYLQHPQWSADGKKLTFIGLSEGGESVVSYNIINASWETLVKPGRSDLQSSFLANDTLFFISSETGTDNVLMKTADNKYFRLTNTRFGASDLTYDGQKILFSDYTAEGNNVCLAGKPVPVEIRLKENGSSSPLLDRITNMPGPKEKITEEGYQVTPYRKWQHLFRFHSWMPFYADIEKIKSDPASIRPGVSLMSQNTLSTLVTSLGYEYSATRRSVFHTRVTWSGWYPVFESQLDYGENSMVYKLGESVNDPPSVNPLTRFSNTIKLPLLFSSGKFSQFLQGSVSSDYINRYIYLKENGSYDYGQLILNGRLYFSNYQVSAYRDIYPRWAQTIDMNYSWAPLDRAIYGTSASFSGTLYLPGILKNNGLRIRYEAEKQDPSKYMYGSMISFPRGYKDIISTKINFLSADYVFPLVYPDFSLSSLLYIKRIRAGLFYDYASGTDNYYFNVPVNSQLTTAFHKGNEIFSSFGFDLLSDFHVFRMPFMISAGVETTWTKPGGKPAVSLLFSMDLFGMNIGRRKGYLKGGY